MPGKRVRRWVDLLLPLAATLTLVSALNVWALRFPARIDLTSGAVYSISPQTLAVIDRLSKPVTITFFYDTRSRAMQDAKYLLEQYAAASPAITLETHDPTLEPAAAERLRVQFAGTAVFESGTRRVTVNEPGEVGFTNALIRVTSAAVGRVCFTDGHIESNPFSLQTHDHFEGDGAGDGHQHSRGGHALTLHERHGMGMAKNALETLGFTVQQRLLLSGPKSLKDCSVVVVASPQQPFAPQEVALLKTFIAAGGPTFILLEPGVANGLSALLAEYGVAVSTSVVRDPASHYWTDPATPAVTDYGRHKITRNLALSFFPGAAELSPLTTAMPSALVVTPLAETSPDAVLAGTPMAAPRTRTLLLDATLAADASAGHARQRLVIAGDGDFATNSFFAALGNGQLFLNVVTDLAEQESLVDIAPREYVVAQLRMTNDELRATFLLTTVLGPLAMLMLGLWQWQRQRQAG